MNIESQVTSLELSKRLKELGVKQESLFYWELLPAHESTSGKEEWTLEYGKNHSDTFSAFTVAELGNLLPYMIQDIEFDEVFLHFRKDEDGWNCWYEGQLEGGKEYIFHEVFVADNEVDCRAKMLVYLLKNKFIKL